MLDLSERTGFHLVLDTDTGVIASDEGFTYQRATRTVGDLKAVLRSPTALPPETPAYDVYYPQSEPDWAQTLLAPRHLTFSPVVLPPLAIGGEFVKTAGHYHPPMPGSRYSYPEVYSGVYGRLLLYLQKRDPANSDTPLDCALIELSPGVSVMIPPDYAHVLINPTADVGVMVGLYCTDFKPDYREVTEHRGLAYYLVEGNGGYRVEPNDCYRNPPPLKRPVNLTGTVFEPPHGEASLLWQSFARQPDTYGFLYDATDAAAYFSRFET
jgi:glucose-6-phosphate isomerase